VVLYTPKDLDQLESHFVLPADVCDDRFESHFVGPAGVGDVRGQPLHMPMLTFRKGETFVGVRVLWVHDPSGSLAPAVGPVGYYHGPQDLRYGGKRLTIKHKDSFRDPRSPSYRFGGAALWVRVGNKREKDYKSWVDDFKAATCEVQSNGANHISVSANAGRLQVGVDWSLGRRFVKRLIPKPTNGVLEVSEKGTVRDHGRGFLKDLPLVRAYEASVHKVASEAPGYLRTADARVWSPMETRARAGSRHLGWVVATRGAKQSYVGSATWRLKVPEKGYYYIWGRVKAPSRNSDSFYVRISDAHALDAKPDEMPVTEVHALGTWVTGVRPAWQWVPMDLTHLQEHRQPTPIWLPCGDDLRIQLYARERGAMIDGLFITQDRSQRP
jgi:hypothetical protein